MLHYDDTHIHGCTYDVHLNHLKTHDFPRSFFSPFEVGVNSSNTWLKRYMIEAHYYWKQHPFLFLDDIHIHGCIDENSLSHLKSSCFFGSLFGLGFGEGSSFTYWIKQHMDDYYFDAYYILLEHNYKAWDPRLCHWSRFDIILCSCVYGPHDDIITWMYKNCHDPLM